MTLRLPSLLLAAVTMLSAQEPSPAKLHRLTPKTAEELQRLLQHSKELLPLVSAHRGGPAEGYPENCIATFEHTLQHTFSMLEIDPRRTKDGAIVVHHDATLERTTTGTGKVVDATLAELKQLRLKDTMSHVTVYQMPTLDEVIEWARGKTLLVLDQKNIPAAERADIVTRHKAEAYVMLIVSSFNEVVAVHRLNPNIAMEVMIPTLAKAEEFDELGVPWKNVVAFVGHIPPEDKALYDYIHRKGACTMIGTSRNLDRKVIEGEVKGIKQLESEYRAFLNRGADIIETDIPVSLGQMLHGPATVPNEKASLFEER